MLIAVNTRFLIKNKLEGIGWFTYEVMKRITREHPEHTFLFLFDRQWDPEFIFSDNIIPVKVWPPARHPYLWKYWFDHALPKIFRKYKPDLFISTDGFLSLRSAIPTLLVIHDLGFEAYPEHTPPLVSKYYRRFTPLFAHKAKLIVTVSEFSKKDIVKRYKIEPSKIVVAYNGANEKFIPLNATEKEEIKQKYSSGYKYFLYVGSIHPRKNIQNLLVAFDAAKKTLNSEYKLLIAGRMAWKTEETKAIYDKMQFSRDVIFTGHLQADELTKVMGAAEAFVFPSLFEGFGIPVLEARYCNVPVICSNRSSIPEVAGEKAIYFDPDDVEAITFALLSFITSEHVLNTEDAEDARKKFNWDLAANKIFSALMQISSTLKRDKVPTDN